MTEDDHSGTPGSPPGPVHPSAWYPDPLGLHEVRSWDGHRWADHVHDVASPAGPPPTGPAAEVAARWEQSFERNLQTGVTGQRLDVEFSALKRPLEQRDSLVQQG